MEALQDCISLIEENIDEIKEARSSYQCTCGIVDILEHLWQEVLTITAEEYTKQGHRGENIMVDMVLYSNDESRHGMARRLALLSSTYGELKLFAAAKQIDTLCAERDRLQSEASDLKKKLEKLEKEKDHLECTHELMDKQVAKLNERLEKLEQENKVLNDFNDFTCPV